MVMSMQMRRVNGVAPADNLTHLSKAIRLVSMYVVDIGDVSRAATASSVGQR